MPSVPGGGHWGGGLWISSRDHARVGQLVLKRGSWDGLEILPWEILRSLLQPFCLAIPML